MQLVCEAPTLQEYLNELEEINYSHPLIQRQIRQWQEEAHRTEVERIQRTYEFVRDEIHHSCDISSRKVTCTASEVLQYGEGLCFAKSHLLASLLRAQKFPTGFCYQRLRADTFSMGYVLHGLNAVYLQSIDRWVRLDARGNKPGIQAHFNGHEEKLAYPSQSERGEIDYPLIYSKPHVKVLELLKTQKRNLAECLAALPGEL